MLATHFSKDLMKEGPFFYQNPVLIARPACEKQKNGLYMFKYQYMHRLKKSA